MTSRSSLRWIGSWTSSASPASGSSDAAELGHAWHGILATARETIAVLPPDEVGACVLDLGCRLMQEPPAGLAGMLERGEVRFHRGSIRGALPHLIPGYQRS